LIDLEAELKVAYPDELAESVIRAYREIESNFALKKWKISELDAGHFVEGVRRIIEHTLYGAYTPLTKSLSPFSDTELKRYEQANGSDEFRILIPRVLRSIYGIRNKRGVGHLGSVSPNEIDATLILFSAKWVLAELFRLASGLPSDEASAAVEQVITRRLSVLWKHEGLTRVLDSSIPARNQVLVLLYDENGQAEEDLRKVIEYRDKAKFRRILRLLHRNRLLELRSDSKCLITPKGILSAEGILRDLA
jgi:hypothetical protein